MLTRSWNVRIIGKPVLAFCYLYITLSFSSTCPPKIFQLAPNSKTSKLVDYYRIYLSFLNPLILEGRGGSCSSWSLQASRSSATKGRCSNGLTRRDQENVKRDLAIEFKNGLRTFERCLTQQFFGCSFVGPSRHLSTLAQLRSF